MNIDTLSSIFIGAMISTILSLLLTSFLRKSAQFSPKNLLKSKVEKENAKLKWLKDLSEIFKNPSEISMKYSRANSLSILFISISIFLFTISYIIENGIKDTTSWSNILINPLKTLSISILFSSIVSNFYFIETMDKYKNKEKLNKTIKNLELKIEILKNKLN